MARGKLCAVAVIMVVSALAGCSGGSSNKIVATCTTDGAWGKPPQGVTMTNLAKVLGVTLKEAQQASYGPAKCDKPVSIQDMQSLATTPHVAVKGQGSNCIAMGSANDPRFYTTTLGILAACAKS